MQDGTDQPVSCLKGNGTPQVSKGAGDQFPHQNIGVRDSIRIANAKVMGGLEPDASVKVRIAHQDNRLMTNGAGPFAGRFDQCRADALLPVFQDHCHRSQEQQGGLPLRGSQKGAGEHDVPQEPAPLLHRLPQGFSRLKLHRFAGGDLDGGAGLEVAAGPGGAVLHAEYTQARQVQFPLGIQDDGYALDQGVEDFFRLGLGQLRLGGNLGEEFCFGHDASS